MKTSVGNGQQPIGSTDGTQTISHARGRSDDTDEADTPAVHHDIHIGTVPQVESPYHSADEADLGLPGRHIPQQAPTIQPRPPGDPDPQSVECGVESKTQDRSTSLRRRWRTASQRVRQKSVKLAERLGRSPDGGESLDPALPPEQFEAADALRLATLTADQTEPDKGHPKSGDDAKLEAERLVQKLEAIQDRKTSRRRKPSRSPARFDVHSNTAKSHHDSDHEPATPPLRGGGILSQLLRLHANQLSNASTDSLVTDPDGGHSRTPSGTTTPKNEKPKWYNKPKHTSTASLIQASLDLSRASWPTSTEHLHALPVSTATKGKKKRNRGNLEEQIRVTVHIAEILARQRYIMQLCRALMKYGAPTHRLEEYMQMTARVLEIDGQFLYLPGCMIMSFDDRNTRTTEVKLVRLVQGVDLSRLADTHTVYKNVVHDIYGVEEAIQELDEIAKRPPHFGKWILMPLYGVASACVGPFAFGARPIDMPIIFVLGCLVGFMQLFLAPKSILYANVFEVSAAILTSFLARAFGSIRVTRDGKEEFLFCFSAMAQSSIAMILPGFLVLCSSLELQSHQMIAGAIRIVYAIIYSLFLGYGVTVGTTIYGYIDQNATTQATCSGLAVWGSEYAQHFPFVAAFILLAAVINQCKWKQVPAMIIIGVSGYVANYFSGKRLGSSSEVANTIGAFTIGVLGNLYSRVWHGHAAIAIIPGIFTMVPSGLASSGSILSGLQYADEVRSGHLNGTISSTNTGNSLVSLGFSMIQIAIGITVGLFIAALVVYPYGKRRSGLFSF